MEAGFFLWSARCCGEGKEVAVPARPSSPWKWQEQTGVPSPGLSQAACLLHHCTQRCWTTKFNLYGLFCGLVGCGLLPLGMELRPVRPSAFTTAILAAILAPCRSPLCQHLHCNPTISLILL